VTRLRLVTESKFHREAALGWVSRPLCYLLFSICYSIASLRRAIADYFRNSSECASMASKCTLRSAPESNSERRHGRPYFGSRGRDYYRRALFRA
jgi:hypothetical protein